MKASLISFIAFLSISCALVPHYSEPYIGSKEVQYVAVNPDVMWQAILDALVDVDYIVKSSDRSGGMIIGEKNQAAPWVARDDNPNIINVFMKASEKLITIRCQSRIQNVSKHPHAEIERFFSALKDRLK